MAYMGAIDMYMLWVHLKSSSQLLSTGCYLKKKCETVRWCCGIPDLQEYHTLIQ